MASTSEDSSTTATAQSDAGRASEPRAGWRLSVALGVWTVIIAGVLLGLQTFWMMIAIGIGHAWGPPTTPEDLIEVWWRWVGIVVGAGLAAIGALVARRWVALVLALLLTGAAGLLAIGLYPEVRPIVAPVEHVEHIDQGPLPCQCYSGSSCDCPGG
ncbi:hypothetical protein ACFC1I_19320 [Microbacterium sp. NPDC056044]|uniref:hypothetical protein n=1 Tax=Microbacterium sp. NPDC056044 TaxID=3345690 RepID=UPI0035DAEBF5